MYECNLSGQLLVCVRIVMLTNLIQFFALFYTEYIAILHVKLYASNSMYYSQDHQIWYSRNFDVFTLSSQTVKI